uniref:Uncharacterized protein n=1 Tax=Arundo donax TaxID=35708 RepID=A0A0A9CHM7_ARUDO
MRPSLDSLVWELLALDLLFSLNCPHPIILMRPSSYPTLCESFQHWICIFLSFPCYSTNKFHSSTLVSGKM